jgi:hypothetical protein
MFFNLHISFNRVELPRPARTTILVVNPILDGGWDWMGRGIVPW